MLRSSGQRTFGGHRRQQGRTGAARHAEGADHVETSDVSRGPASPPPSPARSARPSCGPSPIGHSVPPGASLRRWPGPGRPPRHAGQPPDAGGRAGSPSGRLPAPWPLVSETSLEPRSVKQGLPRAGRPAEVNPDERATPRVHRDPTPSRARSLAGSRTSPIPPSVRPKPLRGKPWRARERMPAGGAP
jgi:hypothetical protein